MDSSKKTSSLDRKDEVPSEQRILSKKEIDTLKRSISDVIDKLDASQKEIEKSIQDKEELEINDLVAHEDEYNYLYPSVLDPKFNEKIANKKEFYDSRYPQEINDVTTQSEVMCASQFELAPHQIFVRNFLSFLTPYNSLLLFHGLGSGKTCSAISVCEEMREYMKQTGVLKKMLIVASPNVQDNFQTQLFDERKLVEINGLWNLKACTGNRLLKEINPMNMKGISKDLVVKQIKKIIKQYYSFNGYGQLSNRIDKIREKYNDIADKKTRDKAIRKHIKREYSNRLIVIDEVHNIRISSDSPNKKVAQNLIDIVTYGENIKLLLLSATPMFNSYKEIMFILKLFSLNDNRPAIDTRDIFDAYGNFKVDKNGVEVGKEIFIRKITGYVSFVQGEDPYSFPYRVFPKFFNEDHSSVVHPITTRMQINGVAIVEPMKYTDCFMVNMGEYQKQVYDYTIEKMRSDLPDDTNVKSGLGWSIMDGPLQLLNVVYPSVTFDRYLETDDTELLDIKDLVGKRGLENNFIYDKKTKRGFEYKEGVVERYGRIFSQPSLEKYSGKLNNVISSIKKSNGVVLVYTQFIEGGCIPIALALEEMGITRYGSTKNLYAKDPVPSIDAKTLLPKSEVKEGFKPAKYVIVSGDVKLSPNNNKEVLASTGASNVYGEDVKVIIITMAGSEGIDFKFIRQIHIMEPWYNNNRNEQIIGRGVRFRSHCALPLEERNVEIYLYGTKSHNDYEPVDMYVYRLAEYKSIQIGKVARMIKENAVDCILNRGNTQIGSTIIDQKIPIVTSTNKKLDFDVGLKPYSSGCDYMEDCSYKCNVEDMDDASYGENMDSYNERFIVLNVEKLIIQIKDLFKERFTYSKKELIDRLQYKRKYPIIQIDSALTQLVEDKTEFVTDMFGNLGHIVNIDHYYLFQPLEYQNKHIVQYDRKMPVDYKEKRLIFNVDKPVDTYARTDAKVDITSEIVKSKAHVNVLLEELEELVDSIEPMSLAKIEGADINKELYRINYLLFLLQKVNKDFTTELCKEFIIASKIDELLFKDKFELLQYCVSKDDMSDFEKQVCGYLNKTLRFKNGSKEAYLMYNDMNKDKMYMKNDKDVLIPATRSHIEEVYPAIKERIVPLSSINKFFTFTSLFKIGSNLKVFKLKEQTERQDRGGKRCSQTQISNIIEYLEKFMNKESFEKIVKNKDGFVNKSKKGKRALNSLQLCMLLQLIARYNTHSKKNGKLWYITNEFGLLHKIKMM